MADPASWWLVALAVTLGLAAGLLVFSFVVLLAVYGLNRRMPLVRV